MELGALINDLYKHARVMDKYHYNVSFSFNPDHSDGGHLFSASQGVSNADQPVGSQQSDKNSDRDSTAYVLIEPTLTRPEDYIAICTEPPTKKLRINDSYYVQSPIPAPVLKTLKRPRNVVVCDPLDALYDETGLRHDESGNVILKTSIFGPTTDATPANDRSISGLPTKWNPPLPPQSLPSASLVETISTRPEREGGLMPPPPLQPSSIPSLDTTVSSTLTTTTDTSSSSTIIATLDEQHHQQTSSSTTIIPSPPPPPPPLSFISQSTPPPPPPPPPPLSNSILPEFSESTVSLPSNNDRSVIGNNVESNTLPRRAGLEIATNEQLLFDELKSFKFDKSTKRRVNQLPPKEPYAQDSRSLMMENIKRFDRGSLKSVNQPSKSKTEISSSTYGESNSLQSIFNKALVNRRSAIIDDDEEEEERVSEIISSDNDVDDWD